MNTLAIVIACGKEEEIAPGTETAFLTLGNSPILALSLKTLQNTPSIDGIIIAVSKTRTDLAVHLVKRFGFTKVCGIVVGGVSRLNTLRTVYAKMPGTPSVVVVHEASRPFVTREVLEETIKAGRRYGCSIAAHKLPDATKQAPKGMRVVGTLERNTVWTAQSPQAFKYDVLESIITNKSKSLKIVDDESEFVAKPAEVHMIECGQINMKIRATEDLALATAMMHAKLV